jgi:alpha-L-arabinofuranosidase
MVENQPLGTISRRLYGHFAEHLGRCCRDGLWVGIGAGPVAANIQAAGIVSSNWPLTAGSPHAVNDPANPERVSPRSVAVDDCRAGRCTVTLPPHSMATIEFATSGASRH